MDDRYVQLMRGITGSPIKWRERQALPESPHGIRFQVTWWEESTGKIIAERNVVADKSNRDSSIDIDEIRLSASQNVAIFMTLDDDIGFDGTFKKGLIGEVGVHQ